MGMTGDKHLTKMEPRSEDRGSFDSILLALAQAQKLKIASTANVN